MTVLSSVVAPKVTPLPLSQVRRQLSEDFCCWCAIGRQQVARCFTLLNHLYDLFGQMEWYYYPVGESRFMLISTSSFRACYLHSIYVLYLFLSSDCAAIKISLTLIDICIFLKQIALRVYPINLQRKWILHSSPPLVNPSSISIHQVDRD